MTSKGSRSSARVRAPGTQRTPTIASPSEVIRRLKAGNLRFVQGKARHSQVSQEFLTSLSAQQRPVAVILGCSDSRVPPELIFDQDFGDLFVIRLAGNIIGPGVYGSIQYAHQHLHTRVLVVLGHEGCGAVQATLSTMKHKIRHPERIQGVVDLIQPGLREVDLHLPAAEQLQSAVEANVRWSLHQITSTPEMQHALREKRNIGTVGAIYELATGRVRWLD